MSVETTAPAPTATASGLADPSKKDIAMQLVSSAENSSLDWRAQYGYIEDIGDGRGYTGGIIGFTSGTSDMLELVRSYTAAVPDNALAEYIPALESVDGSDSHEGLDPGFTAAWATVADDPEFQEAQDSLRDSQYFDPAVTQAIDDGLGALGQFIYYDAIVMHGPGESDESFGGIRSAARETAATPTDGGDEVAYLNAFLDERERVMNLEEAHTDTTRVSTAQRVFLADGNLSLGTPLRWKVYGDIYEID
jgi:chitosanase